MVAIFSWPSLGSSSRDVQPRLNSAAYSETIENKGPDSLYTITINNIMMKTIFQLNYLNDKYAKVYSRVKKTIRSSWNLTLIVVSFMLFVPIL